VKASRAPLTAAHAACRPLPVAADNKLFLADAEGKMTVLKAAAEWEILAVNDLGDEIHATLAQ
jgi:hypothetical protein